MVLRRFAEPPSDSRKGYRHRPQRRKGEQDERTSRFTSDRMVAILRQERQPRLSQPAWRTPEIAELRVYYGRHRIRVLLRRKVEGESPASVPRGTYLSRSRPRKPSGEPSCALRY